MSTLAHAMNLLQAGESLPADVADAAMGEILSGATGDSEIAAFLTALAGRKESAEELFGFASAVRRVATAVPAASHALCPCGTGGSGLSTANTSTAVAFVLAASGVPIAKHGNRAATGACGSADVLEHLGIAVDVPVQRAGELLEQLGLTFLFAPRMHPALRRLAPIRRQLGFATVFNFLGPLCNPAGVERQLLGVSDKYRARPMVEALWMLGSREVLAVTGEDGLDELSLSAPTQVVRLSAGAVTVQRWTPEEVGLHRHPPEALRGGPPAQNAAILLGVLSGKPSAHADLTAYNAGAGLLLMGRATTMGAGVTQAQAVLRSGAGRDLLERYRRASTLENAA